MRSECYIQVVGFHLPTLCVQSVCVDDRMQSRKFKLVFVFQNTSALLVHEKMRRVSLRCRSTQQRFVQLCQLHCTSKEPAGCPLSRPVTSNIFMISRKHENLFVSYCIYCNLSFFCIIRIPPFTCTGRFTTTSVSQPVLDKDTSKY